MTQAEFTLSTLGFDLYWSRLGLGDFPLVLNLQQHGGTFVERDRLLDEERARLRARGLWLGSEPEPRLAAALRTLAAPDLELDLRAGGGMPQIRALAAASGATAVLAVHREEFGEVELAAVQRDSLAPAVLSVIGAPDLVGKGSVVVLTETLDALFAETGTSERSSVEVLSSGFRQLGCTSEDAAAVGAGLAQPQWVAQIGLAYGSGTDRCRAARVLALIETALGRYLLVTKISHDRTQWTTVLPAAERTTHQAVDELLAEAQTRQQSWLS